MAKMSIIEKLESGNRENQPLGVFLLSQLQTDILNGKIKPGIKLTEAKICKDYKVSRTPAREALRQLETDGLIEIVPNCGAKVLGLSDENIKDMCVLRRSLEIQGVRWAIERIDEDEFNELEETFEFMEFYTMKQDLNKMLNINAAFHQIIYKATHNPMLCKLLTTYQTYLRHCNPSNYYDPNYLDSVFKEHRDIYNAFRAKDIEGGALAMETHMDNSKSRKFR